MSRPVSTGTGVRLSAYLPLALWERVDGWLQELDGVTVSAFVQEAVTRYLDDLEAIQAEGGSTHGET